MATGEAKQRSRGSVRISIRRGGAVLGGLLAAIMALSPALSLAQEAPAAPPTAQPPRPPPRQCRQRLPPMLPRPHAAKAEAPDPNHVVIPDRARARVARRAAAAVSARSAAEGSRHRRRQAGDHRQQHHRPVHEPGVQARCRSKNADPAKLIAGRGAEGRRRRALHHRRCRARDAAEDGRRDQGQGSAPHQLQRARRQPARGELPRRRCCTRRRRARCWRTRSPSISSGRSGRTGCWCSARTEKDKLFAECSAPLRQALRRQDRRGAHVHLRLRQPSHRRRLRAGAAADPDLHAERARLRRRSSSPTRATCSATTCPIAPGIRARSPAPPVLSPRAGTRPSSYGAARSSRTASSA